MLLTPPDFISLDRRFERSDDVDSAHDWEDYFSDHKTPRDWSWLRSKSRVVALLAQAGSGKTFEFKHQVDEIRRGGGDAFFLRVERLCAEPFDEAHETPECRALFDAWTGSGREAVFFLDAVDEAKLPQARSSRPLGDALTKLRNRLAGNIGRVSLFVSCRSSEWFDQVEQQSLQALADAVARRSGAEQISVFNATFAPLDLGRIRKLANDRGGDAAIAVLTDSEAISDIVTPLDAVLYLETYQQFHGTPDLAVRFASRGPMLDTSIRRRLAEEGGVKRRSHVDFASALRAVQYLAFGSVVAQTQDISVGSPRRDCIDPDELLATGHASLSSESIRQLLACALFIPAGQGRVRFYRREARDMLAAQWLRDRIEEGASSHKVVDRFIKEAFGRPVVPSVYGSMLAWLASYDPSARRRMIEAAPEWVIEGGDPRSLALEDRIAALGQHFALGPHRFHGEFMFEVNELRCFSRPELENAIVAHFADLPQGDLLDDLLLFVQAGRYRSAVPHLVGILKDFARSPGDRMFAMRALIACGDINHFREVAEYYAASGGPVIPADELFARPRHDRFLLDLLMAAYPHAVGAKTALALCAQLHGKDYNSEAGSLARWIREAVPAADLPAWFVGLDRLCFAMPQDRYRPFGHEVPTFHARAKTLLRSLVEIAARYIAEVEPSDLDRDILIYDRARQSRRLGGAFSMSGEIFPLPRVVAADARFRRALFDRLAVAENHRSTIYDWAPHIDFATYDKEARRDDIRWFLERHRTAPLDVRSDFGDPALFLSNGFGRFAKWRARVAVARFAIMARPLDRALLYNVTFRPIMAPIQRYLMHRRYRGFDPEEGLVGRARTWGRKAGQALRIATGGRGLRQGLDPEFLAEILFDESYEVPEGPQIVCKFGPRVGAALIEGLRSHARRYRSRDHWPAVYAADILALAGYQLIWSADPTMAGIDPVDGLKAAHFYANEWPEWASTLALANPATWAELVVPQLSAEIAATRFQDSGTYNRTLSQTSHLDERVRAILSAPLFDAISSFRLIDGLDIDRLMKVLKSDPAVEALIPDFAARHAREAFHEGAFRRALNWLPFWAEYDEAGLRTLLAWMEGETSLIQDGLGIYLRLSGENSNAPRPSLDLRYRFARLAYSHIRPQDDPPPVEGVHSVTEREGLQRLRSDVGDLLSSDFDAAERAALENLLEAFVVPVSPAWAGRWRNRHAKLAVKPSAWTHASIAAAAGDLAVAPISGSDLHARVTDMIAEIEEELARSDFDRRGLFSQTILESDFRAWLGHALDSRRRPWFSIVQEAETASANRTDLRIELRSSGNAVVVVEIKLVHRWTAEELIDKFSSQLVDRYLLGDRVRWGIYLLVDLGKRPKGAMPDGSTPTSDEIATHLNAEPKLLSATSDRIATAHVFKVAPTKRNSKTTKDVRPKIVGASLDDMQNRQPRLDGKNANDT